MSNTFLNKVVAERAALAVLNRKFIGARQLSGLSMFAIEKWRSKVGLAATHPIVRTLLQVSEVAQTLSNKSNESFTPLTPEVQTNLDKLMIELALHLEAHLSDT